MYDCENPSCNNKVGIRLTLKSGELKGSKVCGFCKNKLEDRKMKKISNANIKRKNDREGLEDYYYFGIEMLKKYPTCENCGTTIMTNLHPHNNIAHILSKQKYKSVMGEFRNMLFLCDSKDRMDGKSCHKNFDTKIASRSKMECFNIAKERYAKFKDKVIEYGNERRSLEE